MQWTPITDGLWLFRDSCNVYAIQGADGLLIIDAGTGAWLDHLDELPAKPAALALTHYFRDHAAGARRAAQQGIAVYAPEGEYEILADPVHHFNARSTYIIYDNLWNLNAPIEPTPLAGKLLDYDATNLAGLDVEVIPLSGATMTQSGYGVTLASGKRVVFCGETMHSPGKLPRVAPLQYNYNDFPGAYNVAYSLHRLGKRDDIDILAPSLGEPMTDDVKGAIDATGESLDVFFDAFGRRAHSRKPFAVPDIKKVTDHVYRSMHGNAMAWFLIGESGKVMTLDYGYAFGLQAWANYSYPFNRRALLHGLDGLKEVCGADRIDVALISHFHDDHVAGVPLLQRLHGTECWASEAFADLLEHPEAHCFPCNWPKPIKVHKRIGLDETVEWEQFKFHFGPMSGHTRFASLIGFEADGLRFAHTGDQVFFYDTWANEPDNMRVVHNHVYRNGALLDGYHQCARWMADWKPDVILTGHSEATYTDDTHVGRINDGADEYRSVHERIMPLGEGEAHFDVDSWGGWIWPYRVHLAKPQAAAVRVTVRNPHPRDAELHVRLVGPDGWEGEQTTLQAGPRAEVACELSITPVGDCRRQPFVAELTVDGQPFGQVAEALMTVGHELF